MKGFPTIVCLCGSARFPEAYRKAQFDESIAGKIVVTIGFNLKCDKDFFGEMAPPLLDAIKKQADELHLRRIDLSNEVLFLNVGGYIGQSTVNELRYALNHKKKIRWLEPFGAPYVRDPEFICDQFVPKSYAKLFGIGSAGDCDTDGHYMCAECIFKNEKEADETAE